MGFYEDAQTAFARHDFTTAEQLLRECDQGRPKVIHDLGSALAGQGRFQEALALYERVHVMVPDHERTTVTLGTLRLATGDYAGGWPLYEGRLKFPDFHAFIPPFAPWRGEPLDGEVIAVCPEQGFGDRIMCARFVPMLRQMGARVLVIASGPLERLFQALGAEVVAHRSEVALPAIPRYYTHPFSMARFLGITTSNIPGSPYLRGSGTRPGRVGVKWRGQPNYNVDTLRSLPPELGRKLLSLPGAVSLEPEDTGARDFQETADLIAGLDYVISVDTSVAHLAGAMGKPVSILLPAHGVCWRWGAEGSSTPWYSTATLYRQRTPGDWASLVEEVAELI